MKADPLQRVRFKKRIEEAHRQLVAGEVLAAEVIYQEMLLIAPEYPEAMHGMGLLCVAQEKLDDAESWLRKAVDADPEAAEYWNSLGEVLRLLGRCDEAVSAYRQAQALAPEAATIVNNLAVGLAGLGQAEEAKSCFRRAIELDPADPHPYSNLGVVLEFEGKDEEALRCYEKALKCKHDFLEAKQNYTSLLSRCPALMMDSMSRLLDDAKTL